MAASAVDKVFDELGKMTVLDLVELKKKIEDAFGAAEKEKSVGGETFGDRIKAGKLPGTAPEGEE